MISNRVNLDYAVYVPADVVQSKEVNSKPSEVLGVNPVCSVVISVGHTLPLTSPAGKVEGRDGASL